MANTFTRRAVAAAGTVALAALATLGATQAASAEEPTFGNIDADRTGSLTIHKFLHQDASDSATEGDIATGANDFTGPVADVEFTVYPLLDGTGAALDLTDAAVWAQLADLTPGADCTAPTNYQLGAGTAITTDAAGLATLGGLALSAYQVCETDAPATIVDRAPAFILTIPMPHENGWVYDVHAFPKNGETDLTKTIDPQDDDLGVGSHVTFPVTTTIPTMGEEWTHLGIRDTFDARLQPAGVTAVTLDGAALDASYYAVNTVDQTTTVEFTAAGIAWLNTGAGAGKKLQVVFDTVIVSIGDGIITNTAQEWINNPTYNPDVRPSVPSNEVRSNWGDIVALKRAAGTTGTTGTLAGATFEVYAATDPYAADCSAATPTGSALAVNGATAFTSDADGIVSIAGLFVSDSEHAPVNAGQRCYVLKETVAPAGYVLPASPFTPVAVTTGATAVGAVDLEIENTQQTVPELPLTGAAGQVILVSAGIALLALVAGLVLVNRRRAATQH